MNINPIRIDNNVNNTLTFGKKLIKKTNVRRVWGDVERVKVFEYDIKNKKDRKQISDLDHKHWGKQAKYIFNIAYSFSKGAQESDRTISRRYFGIEDRYSRTLAIAQVQDSGKELFLGNCHFPNCTKITYIQTNPKEMFSSEKRTYEGLGETLVKEIVQKAKEKGRDSVILYSTNDNFWNNSGFFKPVPKALREGYNIMQLDKKDFDSYIKFVENKTNFENPYLDIYV